MAMTLEQIMEWHAFKAREWERKGNHLAKSEQWDMYHCLKAHITQPAQVVDVPKGYALVPIDPTPAMVKAALDAWQKRIQDRAAAGTLFDGGEPKMSFERTYRAMLTAALPTSPTDKDQR